MPILDQALNNSLEARLAALAAARFGGMPPTVASTGGPSPVLQPWNSVPTSEAPAGAIPNMGLGEQAPGDSFDARFGAFAPPAAEPMTPPHAQPSWLPNAQLPVGILNGAGPPQEQPSWLADAQMPAVAAQTEIPAAAKPTAGPPSSVPQTSLMGRIGQALNDNSSTLMALGGGMAGAPSIGAGIGRGLTAAVPARQIDIKQNNINQTARVLEARGMPADMAAAAAGNPAILQQILPQMFGPKQRKFTQIGEDMYGNKRFGFVDEVSGKSYDMAGKEISGDANAGTPANIDNSLVGDDYLKQFPADVQADARKYHAGLGMPTGNPRKGYTELVKRVAAKWGEDIGVPSDDTTFAARRTMRTQLSSAAPASLGGQINIGNTAMGHLADLTEKARALGNWNVLGPDISHVINTARAHLSSDQAAKVEALKAAAQHYGQEITKFYAGSPGGEGERNRFMSSIHAAKTPQELAAVLETEAELMHSRLGAIGDQIKGVLGQSGVEQYPVIRPDSHKALEKITTNVGRLRGGAAAPAPVTPAAAPAPGQYVYDPATGTMVPRQVRQQ